MGTTIDFGCLQFSTFSGFRWREEMNSFESKQNINIAVYFRNKQRKNEEKKILTVQYYIGFIMISNVNAGYITTLNCKIY